MVWLSQRTLPPSLFTALTDLPCPTTGGTRAFLCLLQGEVRESLRFNAMAIPFVAMFAATVLVPAHRFCSRRLLSAPSWFLPAWLGLLLVAWVVKLSGSPDYW
ncbi:MAG: DUF2752 domain-containing protein [Planctomycetes bacterium]|nr:DUF2752 domain-containing protein [Planctomycetota bacterium]